MYDIEYRQIFECQKGYRNEIWPVLTNDNKMINVTFYKREAGIVDRIKRADAVSEYLHSCGMPTRKRYAKKLLKLVSEKVSTHVGVYDYLPGQTIPWDSYTMERIKNLGKTMSDMHYHLSQMPSSNLPSVYDEYQLIIDRMAGYFARPDVNLAVQEKLGLKIDLASIIAFKKVLKKCSLLAGSQPLHMDFVRGNILFDDDNVCGILDFEKTAIGHVSMDIARTLAFLLVDCKYKTADKITKYFIYSGYQKRGKNKIVIDSVVLDNLVKLFLTYDFYKFLRHNPYESLQFNEHYIRTKDILAGRGVIFYK